MRQGTLLCSTSCHVHSEDSNKVVHLGCMADIKWNFTKFLVNREGEVVKRWETASLPTAQYVGMQAGTVGGREEGACSC